MTSISHMFYKNKQEFPECSVKTNKNFPDVMYTHKGDNIIFWPEEPICLTNTG